MGWNMSTPFTHTHTHIPFVQHCFHKTWVTFSLLCNGRLGHICKVCCWLCMFWYVRVSHFNVVRSLHACLSQSQCALSIEMLITRILEDLDSRLKSTHTLFHSWFQRSKISSEHRMEGSKTYKSKILSSGWVLEITNWSPNSLAEVRSWGIVLASSSPLHPSMNVTSCMLNIQGISQRSMMTSLMMQVFYANTNTNSNTNTNTNTNTNPNPNPNFDVTAILVLIPNEINI